MDVAIKFPICNIIACEDIAINSEQKMYICNPFTGSSGKIMKRFFTYTVIQGIPNGEQIFKIQLLDSGNKLVKQTDETKVKVEENLIRAKTQWTNIMFQQSGEHSLRVLLKCNNFFEVIGSSNLYIK
ncbi:hypothetical protein OXPF_23030 [Oxobacter pfennigii]|uniref:Gylcosyl hydrolase 115 C-terminal domain-containing protein n=1 Tax=Oxobacter pfennigii TaxID=36849 RepID=A0A0N8NT86_9CLOT|nr:hypothetical protein [Oxobacter pfennigii]KPU44136.1 hypothetical protein OXPF_23030 [Oxobacter pfennigii]